MGWLVGPGDPSCPCSLRQPSVLFLGPLLQGWVFRAGLLDLQLQVPRLEREATGIPPLYSLWGALHCPQQPLHGALLYLWAAVAPRSPCTHCCTGVQAIELHAAPPTQRLPRTWSWVPCAVCRRLALLLGRVAWAVLCQTRASASLAPLRGDTGRLCSGPPEGLLEAGASGWDVRQAPCQPLSLSWPPGRNCCGAGRAPFRRGRHRGIR